MYWSLLFRKLQVESATEDHLLSDPQREVFLIRAQSGEPPSKDFVVPRIIKNLSRL